MRGVLGLHFQILTGWEVEYFWSVECDALSVIPLAAIRICITHAWSVGSILCRGPLKLVHFLLIRTFSTTDDTSKQT